MKLKTSVIAAGISLAFLLGLGFDAKVSAQGRRGGGPPASVGPGGPPAGRTPGPPAGAGVDRGLGTASSRSGGRSDGGLGTASERSGGRLDSALDRARLATVNANSISDAELDRYRGLSRKLGLTPEEIRARYRSALLSDPDLRFGQFVAAHVVADNLSRRNPKITPHALLAGLRNGDSIGRTLRNLGMGKDEAKHAEKEAENRIKKAKKRNR